MPESAKLASLRKTYGKAFDKVFADNPIDSPPKKDESPQDNKKAAEPLDDSTAADPRWADPKRERRINRELKTLDQATQKQLEGILVSDQIDRVWQITVQTESLFQSGSYLLGGLPN